MHSKILLLIVSMFALMTSCSTTKDDAGNGTGFFSPGLTDTPSMSSRAEIEDFSKIANGPYLIGPGDVLKLKSLSKDFPDEELKVAPDGTINVTSNGELVVSQKTIGTAEKEINVLLAKRYDNVEIKLVLVSSLNEKILILGDVRSPGVIYLDGDVHLMDVIAKAGGFASVAGEPTEYLGSVNIECRIVRDNGKSVWIDLNRILFENYSASNILLKSNDILYVYKHF